MNQNYSFCIIDDDNVFLELLKQQILEICSLICINVSISTFAKFDSSIFGFDLYFIDIEMPKMNGFEVANNIPDYKKKIVYTTGIEEYVFEVFSNNAYDFVRKRFLYTDVIRVLKRYYQEMNEVFIIHHNGINLSIPYNTIVKFEAAANYIYIITRESQFKVRLTLKNLLDDYQIPSYFLKINKSELVNAEYIVNFNGTCVALKNGDVVVPSKRLYKNVYSSYHKYLMDR